MAATVIYIRLLHGVHTDIHTCLQMFTCIHIHFGHYHFEYANVLRTSQATPPTPHDPLARDHLHTANVSRTAVPGQLYTVQ